MMKPRIAFIARAYPPTVGGMENFALQLCEHLGQHAEITPIINRRGKKALPLFLPYAAAKAIRLARAGHIDAVHLADALLAPVGAAVKLATGVPVTASVCGLDVTYANPVYQAVVPRALRRLNAVMPISAATDSAMQQRTGGVPASTVIPLGVNPLTQTNEAPDEIAALAPMLAGRRVLISVGRLVERKGVAWFTAHVMPTLPDDVAYVVVGAGPERQAIEVAAHDAGVADRTYLLGRVSDDALAAAYGLADAFVMPNIPVAGDMEGFGLVALEASASGLPVVAANLEGITEAVHHGRNGLLAAPRDADAFASAIRSIIDRPAGERRALGVSWSAYTKENFGWTRTAARYAETIRAVIDGRAGARAGRRARRAA